MKAIFFDKNKKRHEEEITLPSKSYTLMVSDCNKTYKVVYGLMFYDIKKRPIYMEEERSEIDTEFS